MWAAPMLTAGAPSAFERRMRTLEPPMLVRAIMRTVWLWRAARGAGMPKRRPEVPGGFGGAGAEGGGAAPGRGGVRYRVCDVAHVATQ